MTYAQFLKIVKFQAEEIRFGIKKYGLPAMETLINSPEMKMIYPINIEKGKVVIDHERIDECFQKIKILDQRVDVIPYK